MFLTFFRASRDRSGELSQLNGQKEEVEREMATLKVKIEDTARFLKEQLRREDGECKDAERNFRYIVKK